MGREFIFHLPNYLEKAIASRSRILSSRRALSEANHERSSSNLILHHGAAGVKNNGTEGVTVWTSQGSAAGQRPEHMITQAKQRVPIRFLK
jgi:hypothetical protein